jgi:hypothetical protein
MPRGGARPGAGRKLGSVSFVTEAVKDALLMVAKNIGGIPRLTEWVKEDPEHEKIFWSVMYLKLLPVQLAGDRNNPIQVTTKVVHEIVDPKEPG